MAIEKWLIQPGESKVIDLELVRRLKVGLIGGKVDVIAHDEPGARVEVHSVTGKELKIEIDGEQLEIDHPQLRWDNFLDVFRGFTGSAKADVSLLVPRDADIKLGVVSAEALVSGFNSDAKISTVNGDVVIDRVTGTLDINTVNGEVSVGNHDGRLDVNTVTGDVTASGRITRFKADGVSGNMVLDVVGTPAEVNTNTVSGDLTVRLDAGSGERYRVNTVAGTVFLDDTTFRGTLGRGFERVSGELAGSWLDLQANSVSGNISVVRRHAPASADTADGTGTAESDAQPSADFTVTSDGEASA